LLERQNLFATLIKQKDSAGHYFSPVQIRKVWTTLGTVSLKMPISSSLNIVHKFPKPAQIMAAQCIPTASFIILSKPIRKISPRKSTPKEEKDDAFPKSGSYEDEMTKPMPQSPVYGGEGQMQAALPLNLQLWIAQ